MADSVTKVSLSPDDAAQGLIDDFDGTVTSMRAVTFDYQGKREPVPAIALTIKPDGDDEEFTDYYKVGDLKTFLPTPDGFSFTPVDADKRKKISSKSKGMLLMKSLVDAGFDKAKLATGDVNVADGQRFHFVRIEMPDYGLERSTPRKLGPDGKPYKDTMLVFEKWIKEEGAAAGNAAGPTSAAAPEVDMNLELLKIATSVLVGDIIKSAGGKIDQKAMSAVAFKKIDLKDPNRNVMLTFLMKPDFLKEYFNLEGGILSAK